MKELAQQAKEAYIEKHCEQNINSSFLTAGSNLGQAATAGCYARPTAPIEPSVKQLLEQQRDEAIARAAAISQKLKTMSPDDLAMGQYAYERKYSLHFWDVSPF
jgi:hypothetical protein